MIRSALCIAAASLACCAVQAQTANPVIKEARAQYDSVKTNLIKAADKMPADAYTFKPVPEIQDFGQRIAHVAGQIRTCGAVKGEQKQMGPVTNKAEIVAALKASFDECDAAWDSMNDASAVEMMAGRGGRGNPTSKLGTLIRNNNHDNEMYGYISVYLRLKGIVPPSSERGM
jgi:hypothetical protein